MKDQYCSQVIESLIDNYQKILLDVRRESYNKFPEEVIALAELLSNYIDLLPEKSEWGNCIHSIPRILLLYSLKMAAWTIYEILNGKYFEAFRDIRFIFEASILSVVMEDVIEKSIYQKCGTLSSFHLKVIIFKLWEKLRDKKDYRNLRNKEKRNKTIRQEIKKFLKDLDLPEEAKKNMKSFIF